MARAISWNNFSVKHKLISLVLLPICMLLILATQQVLSLSEQANTLQRAELFSKYVDKMSEIYQITQDSNAASPITDIKFRISELSTITPTLFNSTHVDAKDALADLKESTISLVETTASEDRLDLGEWVSDAYKQLLIELEKVPFTNATPEIKDHLTALTQLEWLLFWSNEENRLSQVLVQSAQQGEYDDEIRSTILSLIQSQQLFLERFLNLNANQEQVSLLLDTFTSDAFVQSQDFRSYLLNRSDLDELSSLEIETGLQALKTRLELLINVDTTIKAQLTHDVESAIRKAEREQLIFILIIGLMTLLVIYSVLKLSQKVTQDLKLVLKFLKRDDSKQDDSLKQIVKGKDELSQFAKEVQRLSYERQEASIKLKQAKEDAEQAKDDAIQASKAKSSFLANMSHEIRTPLNGVIGISEVLSETPLTATQLDYVDTIETSSHLLLSLINDILDFSKIESGMLLISPHSTCIRESIYDIASIVSPKAKEKGIVLDVSISPNTPYRVMIDDHRLRQVVMNFMSNAVKFTEKGRVQLSIETKEVNSSRAFIELSVSDSGIGIDEEQQKNIFEPFAQEDDSTTRQFGGTGLGLAISTQLVELMGGKIQLDSKKGIGSRFYFQLEVAVKQQYFKPNTSEKPDRPVTLLCDDSHFGERLIHELRFYHIECSAKHYRCADKPAADKLPTGGVLIYVESEPNCASAQTGYFQQLEACDIHVCLIKHLQSQQFDFGRNISAIITQPLLGQRLTKALQVCMNRPSHLVDEQLLDTAMDSTKILIVDDNSVNQKIAGLHVKKAGFEFDLANDGQEAVSMYQSNAYSLILMDCMMPIMDGFEATKRIRELEKQTNKPYVPIVALTASVVDDDIQKCYDVGMNDYVPKPFKANVLKEKIVQAISFAMEAHIKNPPPLVDFEPLPDEPLSTLPQKHERILLVEDNTVNQKVASLLLSKAGYQFEIAENGQVAVDMFQQDRGFDIILMDCMMPIKDGFEATREIRQFEQDSGLSKTPIIALTASVVDDDIQRCFDSGMDAYVPKPIRKEKLIHQIESII
ncbi:response regulator [Vibrio rotiferianus]|uniref:response regulator n=1 Tax=Vibrio rotiferianus TaxID=190895 RepID=UPI0015F5E1CF|nr:response regulator [Vibrio rotiferianus]